MTTLFAHREENNNYRTYELLILFVFYIVIYLALSLFNNDVIFTADFFSKAFSSHISSENLSRLVEQKRELDWIGYLIFPLLLAIKITFPAFCIYSISFLQEIKLKWREALRIVLVSEIIFLLPAIIRSAYFLFYPPESIHDITWFAPFSMVQLVGDGLPEYLLYAAQTINIFEVLYCILLAKGLQYYTEKSIWLSLGLVIKSYFIILLLWIAFITFITIQIL